MKYLISSLTVLLMTACNQRTPVKINVKEWNEITYEVILDNLEIDTGCYTDSTLPQLVIHGTEIKTFKDHLFYFLRQREAFVSCLKNDSNLKNENKIIILEYVGVGGECDYKVLVANDTFQSIFKLTYGLSSDSTSFDIEESEPFEITNFNHFFNGINEGIFHRITIASKFTSSDNTTKCEILGVQLE